MVSEHWYFEDARVLNWAPTPGREAPLGIVFELAYGIEWDREPFSRRVSRAFRFRVNGIRSFSYEEPWVCAEDHWMAAFECIEVKEGISFRLDIPTPVTVVCSDVQVEELPLIEDFAPPGRFSLTVSGQALPSPHEWLGWLNGQHQDVAWHMYRGGPEEVDKVPPNYTGWFLQTRSKLEQKKRYPHQEGVFISECKSQESGFWIQIQNYGASAELWWAVHIIVGQFQDAVIQCGDCDFSGTDWLQLMRR